MKIAMDMQACMSETVGRGIGRYSLRLAQEMHHCCPPGDEIEYLLNDNYVEEIANTKRALRGQHLDYYRYPAPTLPYGNAGDFCRPLGRELIRQKYRMTGADAIYLPNIFDGSDVRRAILPQSLHLVPEKVVAATFYDIIPLVMPEHYFPNAKERKWYFDCLSSLSSCDLLLSISEASRQDAIRLLHIPEDRIVTIMGSVDDMFQEMEVPDKAAVLETYGIRRPFLLYTGGNDYRKNVDGLIRGFGQIRADLRKKFQLVLVYRLEEFQREELRKLVKELGFAKDEIVFTDFVPDETLAKLYNLCELFVFPSKYEGLGMPVIEAMRCGAPVIGADNSSIAELIARADAMFDADSVEAMAEAMARGMEDAAYREELRAWSRVRAKEFRWDRSAKIAWDAIRDAVREKRRSLLRSAALPQKGQEEKRLRIAYVMPSAAGQEQWLSILSELARRVELDLFMELPKLDEEEETDPEHPNRQNSQENVARLLEEALDAPWRLCDWDEYPFRASGYDLAVYHIGNNSASVRVFDWLQCYPGVAVMQDFFLGPLMELVSGGKKQAFREELLYSHGLHGMEALYRDGHDVILRTYPMNKRVLDFAYGVIFQLNRSLRYCQSFYGRNCHASMVSLELPRGGMSRKWAAEMAARYGEFLRDVVRRRGTDTKSAFIRMAAQEMGPKDFKQKELEYLGYCYWANHVNYHVRRVVGSVEPGVWNRLLELLPPRDKDQLTLECIPGQALKGGAFRTHLSNGRAMEVQFHYDDVLLLPIGEMNGKMAAMAQEERLSLYLYAGSADEAEGLDEACRRAIQAVLVMDEAHAKENAERCWQKGVLLLGPEAFWEGICRPLAKEEDIGWRKREAPGLFVDTTQISRSDAGTGIQRVVNNVFGQLKALREHVLAVRDEQGELRTNEEYEYRQNPRMYSGEMERLALMEGDVLLLLDSSWDCDKDYCSIIREARGRGTRAYAVIYDLMPIEYPELFSNEEFIRVFTGWHRMLLQETDGVICISKAVADKVANYAEAQGFRRETPLNVYSFPMGVSISEGIGTPRRELTEFPRKGRTFLMVGTVEPRKGYMVALQAMQKLLAQGMEVQLLIIGHNGWKNNDFTELLQGDPALKSHVLWLDDASDGELHWAYRHAGALWAASQDEGYGLPIIEAAHFGLPAICSDIPVFREVAGDCASYFKAMDPEALAGAVRNWIQSDAHPDPKGIHVTTWKESAQAVLDIVEGKTMPHRVVAAQ